MLLSDGSDRYSTATSADALARARGADVLVYPIALGEARPPVFAELATLTGARSFHVRDARQLPETLRTVAAELRHQDPLGRLAVETAGRQQQRVAFNRRRRAPQRCDRPRARRLSGQVALQRILGREPDFAREKQAAPQAA